MRHQKKTLKLGLTAAHRKALLANQVCSLIEHQRIKTTLAKAKAVRPLAEKMVTLGKKSLNEIKDKLQQLQLGLGMKFDPGLVDTPVATDGAGVNGSAVEEKK